MGASIIERLSADGGRRLVAALAEFRTLAGLEAAATQLAEAGELLDVAAGASFITQEDAETDVFFIVAGAVDVIINGKVVNTRRVGEHVGEMAAIEPTQLRAATITATEPTVVLKVPESDFSRVADAHPLIWRRLAAALSRRLKERNRMITAPANGSGSS
ncbi:Crp/Fnr family transcriptional regulator [Xanthomonas euvesicatoria]|uniref:Crp/Fnr family transcriptional regulator n=1 Tax=Xanthomonas euvesicatoria TaxID=456327 RepID=UPI000B23B405|nr:cyclic nucleotide-binding domain-containing protein [Xanthomonas euvesicatoria]